MEATKTKLVDYSVKNRIATFELNFQTANCYTHGACCPAQEAPSA